MNTHSGPILLVIKGLDIGNQNGGAELFGVKLARWLSAQGLPVILCPMFQHFTEVEKGWESRLLEEGVSCVYILNRDDSLLRSLIQFCNYVKSSGARIYHSHSQQGTVLGLLLKIFCDIKLVRTAHISQEFGDSLFARISRFVFQKCLYPIFVNVEIGVSKTIVSHLDARTVAKWVNRKAQYIPNAVEGILGEIFTGRAPSKEAGEWIICSIGSLVKRKRFDTLIMAMPRIIEAIPGARLQIIGAGPELDDLKKIARAFGVEDRIFFLGQQKNVREFLTKAHAFVLASTHEGLSTVILEATLCRVPVIASDIPENRELVTDHQSGRLFKTGEADDLSRVVVELYQNDDERSRYVEEAIKGLGSFSMEQVGNAYLQVYRTLQRKHDRA